MADEPGKPCGSGHAVKTYTSIKSLGSLTPDDNRLILAFNMNSSCDHVAFSQNVGNLIGESNPNTGAAGDDSIHSWFMLPIERMRRSDRCALYAVQEKCWINVGKSRDEGRSASSWTPESSGCGLLSLQPTTYNHDLTLSNGFVLAGTVRRSGYRYSLMLEMMGTAEVAAT
ncbi:hypothetical protein SAY86_013469 [Trapa natans]|uniref:Uncharacterized protein n=1 Tax=Trapa natans TaxID=22666 RepID=A0AAN7MEJ5_TRANT|nr:hypothetical protein SAY86_013469 [Trapa natans]